MHGNQSNHRMLFPLPTHAPLFQLPSIAQKKLSDRGCRCLTQEALVAVGSAWPDC